MIPDNKHKDIPGNPSTAKSSIQKLRKSASSDTLRVLTIDQWNFWIDNGYVVIKNAVSRNQAIKTVDEYGNESDVGINGFKYKKNLTIDAGNSGTFGRLILALLIKSPYKIKLTGDKSLSRRDFSRVIRPLKEFGANFYPEKKI